MWSGNINTVGVTNNVYGSFFPAPFFFACKQCESLTKRVRMSSNGGRSNGEITEIGDLINGVLCNILKKNRVFSVVEENGRSVNWQSKSSNNSDCACQVLSGDDEWKVCK